jgi:hypothetical protein
MYLRNKIWREPHPQIIIDKPRESILESVNAMNLVVMSRRHYDAANHIIKPGTKTSACKDPYRRY